jgi:ATP-dependent RNA helicase DDX58
VTSVAEEGLDIKACNLIIKYNTAGSERNMIQRRGRARAMNSKSILLCLDDDMEQREIANIIREQMMHQCLQQLQVGFLLND